MTVNEQKLPAGSIKIEKIEITSEISGESFDLRPIVQEFSIYESVASHYLTADMVLVDALSLTSIVPISGHETVTISFKTPHESVLKPIEVTMRIISIEDYSRSKSRTATYVVHMVSEEYVANRTTKIMKSYREQTITDMIKAIHTEQLISSKELAASDSEGQRTIIIPNMNPSKAIEFLCREAKSASFPSSNFVFFENCDGFTFAPLDELLVKRQPVVDPYFSTPKDWDKATDSPRDTAGGGSGGAGRQSTKPFEMLKITHFKFVSVFNNDQVASKGGWENTMNWIDPVYSEFGEKQYNYFEDFDKLKHVGNESGRFMNASTPFINSGRSLHTYYMTSRNGSNIDQDQKPDFYHYKLASFALMSNLVVDVTIPGDTDRRAGDIIELRFPEFGATDDVEGRLNRYISGKYFVAAIRHMYNGSGYMCVMQCIKNVYYQDNLPTTVADDAEVDPTTEPTEPTTDTGTGDAETVEPTFPDSSVRGPR